VVVMLCAANQSNLEGTKRMAEAFERPVVEKLRGGRSLRILPVPARVPKVEQVEQINQFLNDFADHDQMGRYYENLKLDPETAARKLMIPQIPLYSFRERVAVRETGRSLYRNDDLVAVYEAIAREIGRLTQEAIQKGSPTLAPVLQEKSGQVLEDVDRFLAEMGSRCRERLKRRSMLCLAACLIPILIALLAASLPQFARPLNFAAALIPAVLFILDSFTRRNSPRWREIEILLDELTADRAAFLVQRGAFERRLDPALLLQEKLQQARRQVATLEGPRQLELPA
jgi:hypothetical protein